MRIILLLSIIWIALFKLTYFLLCSYAIQSNIIINLKKEDLREFVRVLEEIRQNDEMPVPINSLLRILKIMSDVLLQDHSSENFDYNLHTVLHLITITARILYNPHGTENQELLRDDRRDLLKSIRRITLRQYKTTETSSSLLHLCCRSSTKSTPLDSG